MSAVLSALECPAVAVTRLVPFSEDIADQVLELAREMHAESYSHNNVSLNEDKLLQQLRTPLTNPDIYVKFVERDGDVIGGLFGMVTTVFFSDEKCAREMAWFIRKNRRGSFAAVRLVRDFEQWAKERGARKVFLGQSTGVEPEVTARLYSSLGYRTVGVNTVKEL